MKRQLVAFPGTEHERDVEGGTARSEMKFIRVEYGKLFSLQVRLDHSHWSSTSLSHIIAPFKCYA